MAEEQPKKPRRPRKKKHAHEHHGGAWKVAYADFVTAMMALFLVPWLVSQADQQLKQQIAQYFRSPGVFDALQGGVLAGTKKVSKDPSSLTSKDEEQSLFQTATMLHKAFSTRPEFTKYKDQVRIEVTEEGLKIDILDKAERVSFPSGSAQLTGEADLILAEIARGICQLPNPIRIGGHTDRHVFPAGSTYTNWELSADRANAARRALEAACVRPEQISRVIGYADTELLVPSDPFAPANRRISIVVMRTSGARSASFDSASAPARADQKAAKHEHDGTDAAGKTKPAQSAEERLNATRLKTEGSVRVGTPDELPKKSPTEPAAPPAAEAPAGKAEAHDASADRSH